MKILLTIILIGLLAFTRGKIVFDDLMPIELWPDEWDALIDEKREFTFRNSRVIGTEFRTTATQVAIIATRIS